MMSERLPQILVVDDEDGLRAALRRILKRAGYQVLAVSSGDEAMQCMREGRCFDAVLTDLLLTGVHGAELIRTIRSFDSHVPIVFLTGEIDAERRATLVAAGAFPCLEQPFD